MKIIYESLEKFEPWSGAVDTFEKVKDAGKLDQLESTLDDLYPNGMTETELNDLLWFEEESVFEWVGINKADEDEESEDEEEANED